MGKGQKTAVLKKLESNSIEAVKMIAEKRRTVPKTFARQHLQSYRAAKKRQLEDLALQEKQGSVTHERAAQLRRRILSEFKEFVRNAKF